MTNTNPRHENTEQRGPDFGACPRCGRNDGYLNVGRSHWFVCHEHKLKWWVGANLFSSWKQETPRRWHRNWERLHGYEEVLADEQGPGADAPAPLPSSSRLANATPPAGGPITLFEDRFAGGPMEPTNQPRAAGAGPQTATPQTSQPWAEGLTPPARELTREERLRETADKAITALADALDQGRSDALTEYLGAISRFHRYSFHNVMLIAMQRPDATFVAGFRTWQHDFGRFVMKGEKGIAILAPLVRKARPEEAATDGEDGEPGRRVIRGFRAVYVFDVSQTDGKPMPEFARVGGDPGQNLDNLKALVGRQGIELAYDSSLGGAYGVSTGGKITILAGQAPA